MGCENLHRELFYRKGPLSIGRIECLEMESQVLAMSIFGIAKGKDKYETLLRPLARLSLGPAGGERMP